MELYLIRHGESEANASNTHSGWSPVDLTEKGRGEVQRTAGMLQGISFDRIYVSDVKRAQQTARILFPESDFIFCPLIREINNTAMRGKKDTEMLELFPDLYPVCHKAFDFSPLGWDCESGPHLLQRAGEFLELVKSEEPCRIAAVCHAGFIRACAANVLSLPTHDPPLTCYNASVSIITYRNSAWRLTEWDRTPELR